MNKENTQLLLSMMVQRSQKMDLAFSLAKQVIKTNNLPESMLWDIAKALYDDPPICR